MDTENKIRQAKQKFGIVGNNKALNMAIERAIKVAPHDLSVLIIGESGAGKEFFPQVIKEYSNRRHNQYFAVNCGAIPEGTIDSELFGHEKGAFTGAISERKGYFEEANGGILFLDEVGELPMSTQARLLRVLETGEFIRVGSSEVKKTNVRIVAATNVDMLKAIEEGNFREDLYYRLSTVTIKIPPLRERGEDIVMIARKFAADFAQDNRIPEVTFDESARMALTRYRWPGNVRQLKNIVDQISIFESGKVVTAEVLSAYLPFDSGNNQLPTRYRQKPSYDTEREYLFQLVFALKKEVEDLKNFIEGSQSSEHAGETHLLAEPESLRRERVDMQDDELADLSVVESHMNNIADLEKRTIEETLRKNDGNRKLTAEELGISERTLYRKIKEFKLQ